MVKFFIDLGVDVNQKNYIGRTPLMKAVYLCKKDKVELLMNVPGI